MKYAGADWLIKLRPEVSDFGKTVANVLGQAWQGIYHIQSEVLHKRTDWADRSWIEVVISGDLATWDNSKLLLLIILCHAKKIRLSVQGASYGYLRLSFAKGDRYLGEMPSIEEHLADFQPLVEAICDESKAIATFGGIQ